MVIKYLETYYKEAITLSDLGNKFHVSHYYLSHIFKEQTGYSPMKYVAQLKIGEAQKLLMNTDKSIGSISEELGFNDNSHFNVMFKNIPGCRRQNTVSTLRTRQYNGLSPPVWNTPGARKYIFRKTQLEIADMSVKI